MIARRHAWLVLVVLSGLNACSRKEPPPPPPLDPAAQKQMDLLIEAIQTVQSNYVDESKITVDQLIASTLLGMIKPVDPEALIAPAMDRDMSEKQAAYTSERSNVLVITLRSIAEENRKPLRKIESVARRAEVSGIILDARDCDGHDYEAAALVAGWFLPAKSVAGTLQRKNEPPVVVTTRKKPVVDPDLRMVMLTGKNTRDAAEWLAAALKFHHRAIVVGQPTAGLGLIRDRIPITDEWDILRTAGETLTPDGTAIYKSPVEPDVKVEAYAGAGKDPVLRAGMRELGVTESLIEPAD